MEYLDEMGFVFLDAASRPFWCCLYYGDPWLMYWHSEGHWVTLRKVTQIEIWQFPRNLSPEHQQVYHDEHARWHARFPSLQSLAEQSSHIRENMEMEERRELRRGLEQPDPPKPKDEEDHD